MRLAQVGIGVVLTPAARPTGPCVSMRRPATELDPYVGCVLLVVLALFLGTGCASARGDGSTESSPSSTARSGPPMMTARRAQSEDEAATHARRLLAMSVEGRPVWLYTSGDPDASHRVLVVGCIHGDEPGGIAVLRTLTTRRPPPEVAFWLVPVLNPDGRAANRRQNGDQVDLNRNFPHRWHGIGHPGGLHYSGRHPLSEPESRAAANLILHVRPTLSIWFHQALGVVDLSGGSVAIERRFAQLVDLPAARLPRYPGSATGWENHRLPGTTAFVVELPSGQPSPSLVHDSANAILDVAGRK
jgi:murein peptide amidase A